MTYLFFSLLINLSLALTVLALTVLILSLVGLVAITALGRLREVIHLSAVDLVEIRSRWQQSSLDFQERALLLSHRGKMLEVEADIARMPVRRERMGLLSSLDEVKNEVS